ncbi:hypothetical protein ACOMHN_042482 [Nucella lapillus]
MAHKDINTAVPQEAGGIDHSPVPRTSSMEGVGDITKSSSRFQVARVDSQSNRRDSGDIVVDINHESPQSGPESPGGRRFSTSTNSCTYDTSSKNYDWNNLTEALPREAFYRNIFSTTPGLRTRPTLAELHEEIEDGDVRARNREPLLAAQGEREQEETTRPPEVEPPSTSTIKFGWIKGVLIRCLLNIWGVMLFIRLSWCVAEAGVIEMCCIILVSAAVTTITTLSMSAICTNGVVKGGGAYFMISRSLGPEFGGPIGILFALANTVAVAMYVVGFAETLVLQITEPYFGTFTTQTNDIRIFGAATIIILFGISVCGMEWESRAQIILLVVLLAALASFVIGIFLAPTDYKLSRGFTGFKLETLVSNSFSRYRNDDNFASVFAVFFPAATGILAGANISGDLKDPAKAIPKGTLTAILISTAVYLAVAVLVGGCMLRLANGYLPEILEAMVTTDPSLLVNGTVAYSAANFSDVSSTTTTTLVPLASTTLRYVFSPDNVGNCSMTKGECPYGLYNDFGAMKIIAGFGPLITAGIFAATLSSGLASLVSAPKVFQAVCQDRLFPKLEWFAQTSGKKNTCWRANFLVFILALAFTLIGSLNFIAPLISLFFLATYALINFSCFDVSMTNTPGWRPGFRYYNEWVSLLGFVICIVVMFLISWPMALVCAFIISSFCMYLKQVKPDVNWGSSGQAHVYRKALKFALKLLRTEDHIKTYRPQVLVLTGEPEIRPILVDFVSHITKNVGLMVCGNVMVGQQTEHLRPLLSSDMDHFFNARKARSFYNCTSAPSFRLGVQSMLQNVGIGKFKPNVLIMGFKCNWTVDTAENVYQYFLILHDAFDLHYGVGILRVKEGLGSGMNEGDPTIFNDPNEPSPAQTDDEESAVGDDEEEEEEDDIDEKGESCTDGHKTDTTAKLSSSDIDQDNQLEIVHNGRFSKNGISRNSKSPRKQKKDTIVEVQEPKGGTGGAVNTDLIQAMNRFDVKKVPRGTIDIWWLYDDGGLTLLIPHLLRQRVWKKCQIRIFVPGSKKGDIDKTQRELVGMMKKFRLETKTVEVLPEVNKPPKDESVRAFSSTLSPWMLREEDGESQEQFPWKCSQSEVDLNADKTRRHLRVRELVVERSSEASLIVLTLPMPRKGTCSAGLYMAWLDVLTNDLPPTLLLRGNQKSVLTFYS